MRAGSKVSVPPTCAPVRSTIAPATAGGGEPAAQEHALGGLQAVSGQGGAGVKVTSQLLDLQELRHARRIPARP